MCAPVCALCACARAAVCVVLQLWAWLGLDLREGRGCVPVFSVCTVGSAVVWVEGGWRGLSLWAGHWECCGLWGGGVGGCGGV